MELRDCRSFTKDVITYAIVCSILADTKISAGGAVNASKAYQAIVDAINAADAASKAALQSAIEALEFVSDIALSERR